MKIPNTGRLGPHLFAGTPSAFDALAVMAAEMMLSAIKAVNILPHLPDTKGFSEAQIYDLYAKYVELHGNADAQQALKDGDQVIIALRIETNTFR